MSKQIISQINEVQYKHSTVSDHKCVHIKFGNFPSTKYKIGPGIWKMNTEVINNQQFVNAIENIWWEALNENNVKDLKWWDKCKEKFKCEAIKFSIKKTKDFYKISTELETGLRQIEGLINGCNEINIKEQLFIEKR